MAVSLPSSDPVPMPGRCADCGVPVGPRSTRCRRCHIKGVREAARRSGRHLIRAGRTGGPVGILIRGLAEAEVVIRPYHDRRGALVVTRDEVLLVEVDPGHRMTERAAAWLYEVGCTERYESVMVRTPEDVAELAARLPRRRSGRDR